MPERKFRYLDLLIHVFVVVLLVSNLVGPKIVALGPIRLPFELPFPFSFSFLTSGGGSTVVGPFAISGAQLLFPITYIFGDIFTEVYGYSASRRAIWTGFLASALLAGMGMFTVALPPAPGWPHQEAFETVFHFVPRMVIASLVAYWFGEFSNAYMLAKVKIWTQGKYLWMRTIGSTVVGQFVDTALVMVIAFGGALEPSLILNLIFTGYIGKVLYEAAATPMTYLVVNFLKRREGVDTFDQNTDFNPFGKNGGGGTPVES